MTHVKIQDIDTPIDIMEEDETPSSRSDRLPADRDQLVRPLLHQRGDLGRDLAVLVPLHRAAGPVDLDRERASRWRSPSTSCGRDRAMKSLVLERKDELSLRDFPDR